MPVGHAQEYGLFMPKPDLDNAANFSLVRFLLPFAIILLVAVVIVWVLPRLGT